MGEAHEPNILRNMKIICDNIILKILGGEASGPEILWYNICYIKILELIL